MVYGMVSTAVGQPFDTTKTRMQARPENFRTGALETGLQLFRAEGIAGLYRGALPLFIGGGVMRSFQFGFYDTALRRLRAGQAEPPARVLGVDPQVFAAGFTGGLGRGLVEGPVDFIKTRRQVGMGWSFAGLLEAGLPVTLLRNAFLFASFAVYADWSKILVPGGLGPFWTGAVCANLAWLTIWPLDVVKSQMQSGNYKGVPLSTLLLDVTRSGRLFRGLLPGLVRSTFANGTAMVAFSHTKKSLELRYGSGRSSTF
ncbi:mitochondrial carrier domain-containing protein [Pavlovales sp. CCMP2436]|nr:mitochondrial carrier domain-containing protein [Pavlovales sp. CCMP2436]|mmetsp:Transcript_13137/g.30905  ORF Transcript_13137/g.30905 Transcript_13137/m.30905 type:complete len:257 (+) Transcript_13137:216-986(+)